MEAKIFCRGQETLPLVYIVSQIYSLHSLTSLFFFKIQVNILTSTPRSRKLSLSFMFPSKTPYATPPFPHKCHQPTHFIFLYLIAQENFGDQYRSWSSSSYSILQSAVNASLLSQYVSLNAIFSDTFSLSSSVIVRDEVSHPYKKTPIYIYIYIYIYNLKLRLC